MKTKLLCLFSATLTLLGYSQTDIEQFHSPTGSVYSEMSGTITQTALDGSAPWDFTGLTATAITVTDTYTTNGNASTIETNQGATLQSRIDLFTNASALSITGFLVEGIDATYTENALIGDFPLSPSPAYSSSDTFQGTFESAFINGDILNTSTIQVDVNAFGNLKVANFDGEVTRLKIVQDLDLSTFIGNFSALITSYYFYDANSTDLVFRYTRVQANPPFVAAIDETIIEALTIHTLSNTESTFTSRDFKLQANPVQNILKFNIDNAVVIRNIKITDVSGRLISQTATSNKFINVASLTSGMYIVSLETNRGIVSKRFLKR